MNKPAAWQKKHTFKDADYFLYKRKTAPRIELIETTKPLFQCFELTGHALLSRLDILCRLCRRFRDQK
jgi:hypothetical protein